MHADMFEMLSCFDPDSQHFMNIESVAKLATYYPTLFDDDSINDLKNQAATAKSFFRKSTSNPRTIHDVVKLLNVLPTAFDQILKLANIVITMPVSSASSERFFSTLKRVKTYVRLTMGDSRLSNLMVISVESKFVKTLVLEILVNKFGKAANRRYKVLF